MESYHKLGLLLSIIFAQTDIYMQHLTK